MKRAVLPAAPSAPELLEEFTRSGSQEPFEEVVRRYAGMVYHTCFRVTKNKHDAEDAAQAAFLSLAVQCRAGKPIKAVGPWLQRVAHRLALDIRRSHKRREVRETKHIEIQRTSGSHNGNGFHHNGNGNGHRFGWDEQELQRVMHETLQTLPAKYRMPMILHYFGGLSRDQIASELSCKVSTLGVRIHRGREMLRQKLSARGLVMSADMLSLMLSQTISAGVTESLIASTSLAAQSLAHGVSVDPMNISLAVMSLARRAAHAVAMARLKVAVAAVLLSSPLLFAAGPVIEKISRIDWQQLSPVNLLQHLIPSFDGRVPSLRVEAEPVTPRPTVVQTNDLPAPLASMDPLPLPTLQRRVHVPAAPRPDSLDVYTIPTPPSINIASLPVPRTSIDTPAAGPSVKTASATPATPAPQYAERKTGNAEADFEPVIHASASGESGSASLPPIKPGSAVSIEDDASAYRPRNIADSLVGADSSTAPVLGGVSGLEFRILRSTDPLAADSRPATLMYSTSGLYGEIFRGFGTADSAEVVKHAGRVIADGYDIGRTLDLSRLTIDTSEENTPYGGDAGWYASQTGALKLAAIPIARGDNTITWGESNDDPTLDLVNSARLVLHDVSTDGEVSISLLARDNPAVPTLPGGHNFIGIWQYDSTSEQVGVTDLMIRYDSEQAFMLGLREDVLKLWVYSETGWFRIMDDSFGRDLASHQLWGTYAGEFTHFAVSAPEPTGLLLLVSGSLLLMRRNRRKI